MDVLDVSSQDLSSIDYEKWWLTPSSNETALWTEQDLASQTHADTETQSLMLTVRKNADG